MKFVLLATKAKVKTPIHNIEFDLNYIYSYPNCKVGHLLCFILYLDVSVCL